MQAQTLNPTLDPLVAEAAKPSVSIVIPAYNEENRLPRTMECLLQFFSEREFPYEILIVNDGSTDMTEVLVGAWMRQNVHVRLLNNESNQGKGFAVQQGMLAAAGDYIFIYDADGATPIEEVARFMTLVPEATPPSEPDGKQYKENVVYIGSRALNAQDVVRNTQLHRKLIGRCFNLLLFGLTPGLQDTQCGFKMFPRAVAQQLFQRQTLKGFAFDVEVLHAALRNGISVREIPVNWSDVDGSKVNVFVDSWIMLASLFKIYWNGFIGRYKVAPNFPKGSLLRPVWANNSLPTPNKVAKL